MGEEALNSGRTTSDVPEKKGILKNKPKDDKRVPISEPLIVPEKAHILCPTDSTKDSSCAPNGNNISDNTSREFLIQKRSSLTHTPDITRVFGANAQKLSSTSESLHEFQKVKLRHVENTAGGILSPETIRKADERRKSSKDIIVDLSPAPIKYNIDSGNLKDNPTSMDGLSSSVSSRKTSYENCRTFGERSSSFTQVLSRGSSFKRDSISREMSASMYSPSTTATTNDGMTNGASSYSPSSASQGRKSLISRGGSSSSLMRTSDEKKPSIIRESQTKSTSVSNQSGVTSTTKDAKKTSLTSSSSSGAPVNPMVKRSNSGVEAKDDKKKKIIPSSTTTKAKSETNTAAKKPTSTPVSKAMTTSSSKENKKPVNSHMKKDEHKGPSTKNDKKPLSIGNNDRSVRKSPSFKKPSTSPVTTKNTSPKKTTDTKVRQNISSRDNKNSTDAKKTPEVRRRVVQKPSTVDRDAMRSKVRQSPSPSLRRKVPSPTTQPTKKLEPKKKLSDSSKPSDKESDKSEESTKRPERVSGVFRPTQSWLCYMGDKADMKSHAPGLKTNPPTPGTSRKRSGGGSGERKSSAPVRRTESFDKKKSISKAPSEASALKRSSSLRSNREREVSSEAQLKRPSLKKTYPPPTLPKPAGGKNLPVAVSSLESADTQDSGIEETSIKASSVIQKFEAVKGSAGRTSILGSPESGSGEKVTPYGHEEIKQDNYSSKFAPNKAPRSSLVPFNNLSPIMVTNEEYSSQKMQSHSRSGSIVSGGDNGHTTNGYQSAEKYKTTMVVRLHPGQTRKLSNCSTTTADSQSPLSNSGSFCRDTGTSSNTRKYSSISNSSIGSVSSLTASSLTQQHRYSADIHGSDCEKGDSTSCCASGLEITFESPPQTIDIKLIPSPSVEERKTLENDEEGNNNLISQEQTDKTRQ